MKKVDKRNADKGSVFFDRVPTRGRPKLILNDKGIETIEALAGIMCTVDEIADVMNTTADTLTNKNNKDAYSAALKKGRNSGKASLRRYQFECAKKGNPTMLVWLGKQYLDQKDHIEQTTESPNININISPATENDVEKG